MTGSSPPLSTEEVARQFKEKDARKHLQWLASTSEKGEEDPTYKLFTSLLHWSPNNMYIVREVCRELDGKPAEEKVKELKNRAKYFERNLIRACTSFLKLSEMQSEGNPFP
jgi:ribosomal protein L22